MSWDMSFYKAPTIEEIKATNNYEINGSNQFISVRYVDDLGNERFSGFYAKFGELKETGKKVLYYGTINHGMNIEPIFKQLYKDFGTIVLDCDSEWFFEKTPKNLKNEDKLAISNVQLCFYLCNKYNSLKDGALYHDFVINNADLWKYLSILKENDEFFSVYEDCGMINLFLVTFDVKNHYYKEADETYWKRKKEHYMEKLRFFKWRMRDKYVKCFRKIKNRFIKKNNEHEIELPF